MKIHSIWGTYHLTEIVINRIAKKLTRRYSPCDFYIAPLFSIGCR